VTGTIFRVRSLCVAAFFAASSIAAQAVSVPGEAIARVATASRLVAADSARASSTLLPSVSVAGAPRSFQVVSIPVPEALFGAAEVDVEIVTRSGFSVLGARRRSLGEVGTRKRSITVTIGVPASSLAGRVIAAEIRFTSTATGTLVVPVEMTVALVRSLVIRSDAAPLAGNAGTDIVVAYEVVNFGNSHETVFAELDLPTGWPVRGQKATQLTLDPGETVKRRARLAIPALASTGSSFVRVDLREGSEILGSSTIRLEVSNSASVGRNAGPQIVSAISHATDEFGRRNRLLTVHASGALFDSVRIDARLSHGAALGGAANSAVSRLGTYQAPFSLVLASPSAQLSVGHTGTSLSDLTGLYPYGEGALFQMERADWDVTAFGARSIPTTASRDARPMLGLFASKQFGELRLHSSVSHLTDGAASTRKLDAAGIGASMPSLFGSVLKAEVAQRRFMGGSGFGWSGGVARTLSDSDQQLTYTHAPGGSDAFARATDEAMLRVTQRISSRASLNGSAWRTSDETSVFSALKSNGFSLRPQYNLFSGTTLSLEVRSYLFDATTRPVGTTAAGAFGNREQQVGVGLSTSLRQFYAFSSAYLGTVTRTVTPSGQATLTDKTPRNYWTTNAGWAIAAGRVEVQTRIEQTRDAAGFVHQQTLYGARVEQVLVPYLGGIRGEGEVQRLHGSQGMESTILRVGAAVPLSRGFAVRMNLERNSIFRSTSGRAPWILAARFEHTIAVPMLRRPGVSGYVFQDLNGNQRRDAEELGVPGAIVRRGPESAVADERGKFRVGGDAGMPIAIDEASLPDGWMAPGIRDGNLAITLSGSAEVQLVLAPRSRVSDVDVDLTNAQVVARDSSGREWTARMKDATTALFDALPPGTYTLLFDLSGLSEPLVARAPVPLLIVTGREAPTVKVTLDPRPIRMWQPSAGASKGIAPSPSPTRP